MSTVEYLNTRELCIFSWPFSEEYLWYKIVIFHFCSYPSPIVDYLLVKIHEQISHLW
jgi:hypothetical protein